MTLLCIPGDFNRAVVWIFSILPLISIFPSLFFRPLVTIPSSPTTIGVTVTFMFHTIRLSAETVKSDFKNIDIDKKNFVTSFYVT